MLPTALAQTLVGETFSGYLNVGNPSNSIANNVVLVVELQVGTSRNTLFSNVGSPVASMGPGDFLDAIVSHELRDAGTYVLTCIVSYHLPGALEPKSFKRSYRFPALHPFAVSHRVCQQDTRLLVECLVENATQGCIFLTGAKLDCIEGFQSTLMCQGNDGDAPKLGGLHHFTPRGAFSLLFQVMPIGDTVDVAYVKDLASVGQLVLSWHVPEGASGCSEHHQILLQPRSSSALDLRIVACPQTVGVENPFTVEVEVVNRSNRTVEPLVVFNLAQMEGVHGHGPTRRAVGSLEPYCTARVKLPLFVVVPGLHSLKGISLVDDISKAVYEFDSICDILGF